MKGGPFRRKWEGLGGRGLPFLGRGWQAFSLQERREREQQDLEFAKEMAEDDDDSFP